MSKTMSRLDFYMDILNKAKSPDEFKGILTVLLIQYSHNIISRMDNNTSHIMEWLEEEVKN